MRAAEDMAGTDKAPERPRRGGQLRGRREDPPGRTRRGGRSSRRALAATGLLAFVLPITIGIVAQWLEPVQWRWDDWASLITSVLLGSLFFVLALIVGGEGTRRGRGVADAELLTSIGALQMSGARSFAGSDQQALRIAGDARAALQHYPNAGADEQKSLVATIEDTYSDLAFGTFCRADALPRSVWDQLGAGARAVAKEARDLALRLDRKSVAQRQQLNQLADNVCFALSIGHQIRKMHQPSLGGKQRILRCSWDGKDAKSDEADSPPEHDLTRKERLRCLYRRELTVKKDWDLLFRSSSSVDCSVVLQDLAGTEQWCAPWYVTDSPPPLRPVSVLLGPLGEAAALDVLVDRPGLDRYPNPIRHGAVPRGMRSEGIANLCDLLRRSEIATVCVLVYDVIVDEHTTTRLVLDGNHRLAAARALAKERRAGWRRLTRSRPVTDIRVLAFVLSESEPLNDPAQDRDPEVPPDRRFPNWQGFIPDIGLVRGTWIPPRYRDELKNGTTRLNPASTNSPTRLTT